MRRELRFKTLDEARAELTRLESGPVETTGHWSYFQILAHCAKAVDGSTKGVAREMTWWKRHVTAPISYYKTAWDGFLSPGIGAKPGAPVERVEGDEKAALSLLRTALDHFEKFEGKMSDHPRLGGLNKKQWTRFHAWHLANHLGNVRTKV